MEIENDVRALDILVRLRETMGPDPFAELLKAAAAIPEHWRTQPAARNFQEIRCRLRFTQAELAGKAGLVQSQVSRVEGGEEALLSTWTRLYEAMGFGLVLLPVSAATVFELEKRAEVGRPKHHWMRQRARPRRKRRSQRKETRANPAGTRLGDESAGN